MTPQSEARQPTVPAVTADGRAAVIAPDHMRVVVFSDAIPGRNGVGTFYDDLADALEEHVGAIRIIAPPENPTENEPGWSIRMPGDPTQRVHIPSLPALWNQVRWTQPHVILAATPSAYGVVGLLLAARLRTGSAYCYHTEFPKLAATYWTGIRRRVMPFFLRSWDRLLIKVSPAVLAPNRELSEVLAAKGRSDAHVVGTLAPRDFIERPVPPAPTSIESIAFIGRLAPEKRIDQVLDAAKAFPDLAVRVVGDGPLRDEVDRAAAACPNIAVHRWVDRDGVREILDTTDLVVLPSKHETFGTAAFEAMVRGRLTLVSPACGITEWPELCAALFIMEPEETLTQSIARVRALPPDALRSTGERARAAATSVHAGAVHGWLGLLQQLARSPQR